MPLYQGIRWNELERLEGLVPIPMYYGTTWAGVRMGRLPGTDVPVYFLEYNRFFDRPDLYGPPGQSYQDNLERFTLFRAERSNCARCWVGFPTSFMPTIGRRPWCRCT